MNYKAYTILFSFLVFVGCTDAHIELLCMDKISDRESREIYLVKNAPQNVEKFKQLIFKFNNDLDSSSTYCERLFLRPHHNSIIDKIMGDEIDYSKNGCKEIDNIDFISEVSKIKFHVGGDTIVYRFYGKYSPKE